MKAFLVATSIILGAVAFTAGVIGLVILLGIWSLLVIIIFMWLGLWALLHYSS